MYSEPQRPSRAEGPAAPRRRLRTGAWILLIVAFLAASTYAVGGRGFVRRLLQVRARTTAALQPPTAAEIRSAEEAARQDSATLAEQAVSGPAPATVGFIATWIGTILVVVVVAFYVTGRAGKGRRA